MKILIVDDHTLFREGLGLLIRQLEPDVEVVLVGGAEEAMPHIQHAEVELVLLDWNLVGLTGEDALNALQALNQRSRIVILSAERDAHLIKRCIDLGASGFIHKDSTPALLIAAIRSILKGEVYLPPDAFYKTCALIDDQANLASRGLTAVFPELTPRQIHVLSAMVRGLPNKLIAREMSICEDTVKQHLSAIYRIMHVQNRTQAVYTLAQHKLSID